MSENNLMTKKNYEEFLKTYREEFASISSAIYPFEINFVFRFLDITFRFLYNYYLNNYSDLTDKELVDKRMNILNNLFKLFDKVDEAHSLLLDETESVRAFFAYLGENILEFSN